MHSKGWLNEVDTIFPREISTLYTLQLVKEIALKCSTYSEFRTKHRGAYKAAIKITGYLKYKQY